MINSNRLEISAEKIVPISNAHNIKAYIDFAARDQDNNLIMIGWVYDNENIFKSFSLIKNNTDILLEKNTYQSQLIGSGSENVFLTRVPRQDVAEAMSSADSKNNLHGFVLIIQKHNFEKTIALCTKDYQHFTFTYDIISNLLDIKEGMARLWPHSGSALKQLLSFSFKSDNELLQFALKKNEDVVVRFQADSTHSQTKPFIEHTGQVLAAIDHGYALGQDGLLFFGWAFFPEAKPESISLFNEYGHELDITASFTALRRQDVVDAYKSRFGPTIEWSGFVCYVPVATAPGDQRALCFNFAEAGKKYIKIATEKISTNKNFAIRDILRLIPEPTQMHYKLHELFDSGLGKALACIHAKRSDAPEAQAKEFGVSNPHPEISILVPLYGRYDFLRYQLAQFADDTDFKNTDLIYIVDDPMILHQTLELAAKYQALFKIPFRIVWNGENRGFAAANNLGASVARGDYLVLLNSDVIPKSNGWLTTLKQALDTLPQAGAVAPLLQFGDDSIQHAGMYPREDPLLPGFLLNTHKGMGMNWDSNSRTPSEHPMLTAACLMIKTALYKELGGLDEGYVFGDFEDADLCMMLHKKGHKLYLVPEAKLWHLERQSQSLNDLADTRQMVTLFNGWRYLNKIKTGILPAPSTLGAAR
jgi:GT2 family glycosyltransferase